MDIGSILRIAMISPKNGTLRIHNGREFQFDGLRSLYFLINMTTYIRKIEILIKTIYSF